MVLYCDEKEKKRREKERKGGNRLNNVPRRRRVESVAKPSGCVPRLSKACVFLGKSQEADEGILPLASAQSGKNMCAERAAFYRDAQKSNRPLSKSPDDLFRCHG